jgi:transcription antitermination factor NusG
MTTTTVPPGVRTVPPRRPSLATACAVWGSPLDPCLPPHPREPGAWYALRVAPQAEFVVAHLLRRRGVVAWAPCLTKWIRQNRYHQATRQVVRRPLLPGYLFVKLAGAAVWPVVFGVTGVIGVVSFWGRPWPLRSADVSRLRHASSRLRAREGHRAMPTNRAFEVGQTVEALDGPLEGTQMRVVEILGSEARALVKFLGVEREIQISVANLGAVA